MSTATPSQAGAVHRPIRLPAPLHYLLHTLRLTVKNTGFMIFSVVTPVVLYVVFTQIFGAAQAPGGNLSWAAMYMVSMAAYGSLGAAMGGGSQLAVERRSGWFRQLTITTLRPRAFLLAKAGVIMIVVLPALVLVFAAGFLVGDVRAPAATWAAALLLMWLSLIPVAVLGLVIGLWVKAETVQGLTTLTLLVMAMLGGLWFPAALMPTAMQRIAELLPSYWIAELGRYPFGAGPFPWIGVLVLGCWTIGLTIVGALGYRRAAATSKR
ncbi:ABC transporter permease [Microlunatus soli]|uniref:Transport permease protein n=1 Tax=Microlunatus soli TaxID=630515 RepID=A0A1H1WK35_9ACTN|nr:ABC transporter permease [Microlunatus soli]SDS97678.1 ABC-2 type transport system permease protein [Microlunatus soli]